MRFLGITSLLVVLDGDALPGRADFDDRLRGGSLDEVIEDLIH